MPVFQGVGDYDREPDLLPGYHRVIVDGYRETKSNTGIMAVLKAKAGTIADYIPINVDPSVNQGKNASFKFWRMVSRFGYPSLEYWDMPKSERPACSWDPKECITGLASAGAEAIVQVALEWNSTRNEMSPTVTEVFRVDRSPVHLEPGESQLAEPEPVGEEHSTTTNYEHTEKDEPLPF